VKDARDLEMNSEQTAPIPNENRPVWELVIEDMWARDHTGRRKYGTPLQAGNGRDALIDAYQEALDLCVYLRQAIEEREASSRTLNPQEAGEGRHGRRTRRRSVFNEKR
jgi:hypothetical protein